MLHTITGLGDERTKHLPGWLVGLVGVRQSASQSGGTENRDITIIGFALPLCPPCLFSVTLHTWRESTRGFKKAGKRMRE